MNVKEIISKKSSGFYVGAVSAVLALVTLFIYIGMDSMYFTGLVVAGLAVGIAAFVLSAIFSNRIMTFISYFAYMFALYHFLVLEINYRMDILVDTGLAGLDAIFIVAVVMFIVTIVTAIVSSCMKQEK